MNFKNNILAVLVFCFSFLLAGNALAVPGNPSGQENAAARREEAKANIAEKFCEKLSDLESKMLERLSNFENKAEERKRTREEGWEEKSGSVEENLDNFRLKQDENFAAHIARLNEKATTDEQKAAVAEFQETMKTAISTRRAAVDAAVDTFRDSVNKLVSTRQDGFAAAASTFKSSVEAAFDSASSDCSSGKDAKTIRQNLQANLKAAREKFISSRQSTAKISDQVQTLNETKKQAIEKAVSSFKATLESAVAELKKSFPKDAD